MSSHKKGSVTKRQTLSQQAECLCKKYRFTKEETEKLLKKFQQVTQTQQKIDRWGFRTILHNMFEMTDDTLMDRVFRSFDKDNDTHLNQEEWIRGMHILLQRANYDDIIAFCFDVYDTNSDGFISREEMFQHLKCSMVKQATDEDPEEGIKDLVEIALKQTDKDHDNRVSLQDFNTACHQDRLLLESFGPCLPSEQCVARLNHLLSNEGDTFDKIPVTVQCHAHTEQQLN